MNQMSKPRVTNPLGRAVEHDSASQHVTGQAIYCDDIREPAGCLHAAMGLGPAFPARIISMDIEAVRQAPGVVAVYTAADIPGENNAGSVVHDEPLLASDQTSYPQQPLFIVAAESRDQARRAARMAKFEAEELPAAVTFDQIVERDEHVMPTLEVVTGDAEAALAKAEHKLEGRIEIGGQEHMYLEGQIALALPSPDGLRVVSSTQHPTEVQELLGHLLELSSAEITVEVRRMGGAFGGKESQAAHTAMMAALAAYHTGRPVKLRLDRDDDMVTTGKRHEFRVDYSMGYDNSGRVYSGTFDLAARCGHSADLSAAVCDRAVFHSDNAYFVPEHRITSHRYRSNTVSNTAYRGFGGPQGMVAIERAMDQIAARLGKDPLDVRYENLYGHHGDITPYGMQVKERTLEPLMRQLEASSDYRQRRAEIEAANQNAGRYRRGIALTPVKFGISFTISFLNQAGALLNIYKDGSILINHGGTEMGQGLYLKVAQVVAHQFGVPLDMVKISATRTDKVPNTSPTAASSGTDLNGAAALVACKTLKQRLTQFLQQKFETDALPMFKDGRVSIGFHHMSFAEMAHAAWFARIPLSATGHFATPGIGWDSKTGKGRPFFYFAHGAAVSEVEIDTLTGANRVVRADLLHDVGQSINPAIDLGQIEGAYIQGMGWLTMEQLVFNDRGQLLTHAPSTYKIPTATDRPDVMNIALYDNKNPEATVHRSKAVGEPPFMLAISVHSALAHAISGLGGSGYWPDLNAPATAEEVLRCVDAARAAAQ